MAYYLQNIVNIGTVLEPIRSIEYWKFDKKIDRDNAVDCIHCAYPEKRANIAVDATIKEFDHFRDIGILSSHLKMIAKV
ncbi:hypothetical protein [Vibrio phage vB_VibM_10AMN]|uniref:Uncharacterized protein n=1 Tax=Staphylococcus phage vB_VibM_10AMN12 TaxID=3076785 RepID=A0AA96R3P6_9CAUD|nr:hypothetical protein [Vibrio phage vB_VibM_10AMN]WNO47396.1 hypothetical protein [Staphylococcus phage vB_VibM_10AMN12]